MSKSLQAIFPEPVKGRLSIYAYSIQDEAHAGQLKIGQTTQEVKVRVAQQLKTAGIKNYKIELEDTAEKEDGSLMSDHDVRARLAQKGFNKVQLEWMECTLADVQTAILELRQGKAIEGTHH